MERLAEVLQPKVGMHKCREPHKEVVLSSYIYYSVGADGQVEILPTLRHSRQLYLDDIQLSSTLNSYNTTIENQTIIYVPLPILKCKYGNLPTNMKQGNWVGNLSESPNPNPKV